MSDYDFVDARRSGDDEKPKEDTMDFNEAHRSTKPLEDFLAEAAEDIYDGWFSDDSRIDWDLFIDRLEEHTEIDFGSDMTSLLIKAVKRHIRAYRKLG